MNFFRNALARLTKGALFLLIGFLVLMLPQNAVAHPMGNFSISHFAGLRVGADSVGLKYILDMAEIPTFQEMQASGIAASPSDPRVATYLASKVEAFKSGLTLTVNGRPLVLETVSDNVIFPPGAGNLPTMKIGVIYRARFSGVDCPCTLDYRDYNFSERAGWKEVVTTAGPGAALTVSSGSQVSRSQELANYPTDLINSPPQDLSAHLTFALASGLAVSGSAVHASAVSQFQKATAALKPQSREGSKSSLNLPAKPASPVAASGVEPKPESTDKLNLEANKQGTPRNSFTELITSNRWGLWFLLSAALIAAALGGLHALEPGHGKTIVAAYLVGSQGTAAHALLLGLIVTATHTAGVYALGLITLYASKYIVPDHLYPWLSIGSGLTIAFLGFFMLRRRWLGQNDSHGHHHGLWGHSHSHGPAHDHAHHHGHSRDLAPSHEHPHAHSAVVHSHDHAGEHSHLHATQGLAPSLSHHHEHPHHHAHDTGHSHAAEKKFSYRQLVTLGVTGGIVPCPAALVVLLSAISLHRVAFGLYLIVAFSLGLAAVLISIGMVTVFARRLLSRLPTEGPLITRWLPAASALAITLLGVGIAGQAIIAMGAIHLKL